MRLNVRNNIMRSMFKWILLLSVCVCIYATDVATAAPTLHDDLPYEARPDTLVDEDAVHEERLVMILSVPGLSFLELSIDTLHDAMPYVTTLLDRSAIAALNIRTPERGIEDVYLTINSGAPVIAPSEVRAYPARDETSDAVDRYTRYMGQSPSMVDIVVPETGYLTTLNETQTYNAQIGKLGDVLLHHGVQTAVFGHRPDGETSADYAPLMLMTSQGTVPSGDIREEVLTGDPDSPYGRRTDTHRIVNSIEEFLLTTGPQSTTGRGSKVILIEYSDWFRLDQERRSYEPQRWIAAMIRELTRLDQFVGHLKSLVDTYELGQLWIMSPQPHTQAARDKLHVTPFIIYESNMKSTATSTRSDSNSTESIMLDNLFMDDRSSTLLTSPTTKRVGLISLHDLGPTLIAAAGIEESVGWTGFPVDQVQRPDAWQWLMEDVAKMRNVYELRTIVVIPFVTYEVFVLLLGLLMVLLKRRQALKWMRLPLFSILTAPLFILLLGSVAWLSPEIQLAILFFTVTVASVWCMLLSNEEGIILIALVTTAALVIDGWLGARLVRYSIMGYDPMIGARYYGIGNEYMGVLVGSTILAVALLIQRMFRRIASKNHMFQETELDLDRAQLPPRQQHIPSRMTWRVAILIVSSTFLMITWYMANPHGGTNAGGALTASAAFGIAWLRMFGHERLRQISLLRLGLIVGGFLVAGLTLLWAMNQWLIGADSGSKSHIGRAMELFEDGRIDLILGIILRKLQMNLNLIGVSSWGKVLLTSIFVLAVLLLRPRGTLRQWQETRPYWLSGFTAIIIGSIVALALNDSGIVAAGTMIIFAAAPILLLISEQSVREG